MSRYPDPQREPGAPAVRPATSALATGDRTDLRASHEDRDEIVEQLRVAAGDGRLTAEELDERLEAALEARTYGELAPLVRDLPTAPATANAAAPVVPAVPAKELVRMQTGSGNLQRVGPWTVPRRLEVETRSGNVLLDFTQAVITHPVLELALSVRSGNLVLVGPPGMAVEVDGIEVRSGNVRQRTHPQPGTPIRLLVQASGNVRSGNVIVRGPRRNFWDWLMRRPAPTA